MTGLPLIKLHGLEWAVSSEFADAAVSFFDNLPEGYLAQARKLVEEDMKASASFQSKIEAGKNKPSSAFSNSIDNGILTIVMKGEIVEAVSSYSLFRNQSYVSLDQLGFIMETIESEYDNGIRDIKAISLVVDSPGGVAIPSMNMARRMNDLSKKIPMYTFGENTCCSAMYALTCFSTEVWSAPYGVWGSVGSMSIFRNSFPGMKNSGIELIIKTSGKNKNPLTNVNEDGILHEDGHKFLQERVNELGKQFSDFVFANREFSDSAKAEISEAGSFFVEKAKELNLIDNIGTYREYQAHLNKLVNGEDKQMLIDDKSKTEPEKIVNTGSQQEVQKLTAEEQNILNFCSEKKLNFSALEELLAVQTDIATSLKTEIEATFVALTGAKPAEGRFENYSVSQLKAQIDEYNVIIKNSGLKNDDRQTNKVKEDKKKDETLLSAAEAANTL